jgi:nitroreductase
MNSQKLLDSLSWRYATKHFDPSKKLDEKTWQALEKSLILSPSSYGLQPYKFILVQDQNLRKKLRVHSWNQPQIEDSSHLIVFLGKKTMDENYIENYVNLIAAKREIPVSALNDYKKMMVDNLVDGGKDILNWSGKQAYIALGNLLTSAALLEVDACPMEGMDVEKYDEILGLEESDYTTLCVCALGFRSADDKYQNLKKVRFDEEKLVEIR